MIRILFAVLITILLSSVLQSTPSVHANEGSQEFVRGDPRNTSDESLGPSPSSRSRFFNTYAVRVPVWITAQVHLYMGFLFMGVTYWILAIELFGLMRRNSALAGDLEEWNAHLVYLFVLAVSILAIFGILMMSIAIFFFGPFFRSILLSLRPFLFTYGMVFLVELALVYSLFFGWAKTKATSLRLTRIAILIGLVILNEVLKAQGSILMEARIATGQFQGWPGQLSSILGAVFTWNNLERIVLGVAFSGGIISVYGFIRPRADRQSGAASALDRMSTVAFLGTTILLLFVPLKGLALYNTLMDPGNKPGLLHPEIVAWSGILMIVSIGLGISWPALVLRTATRRRESGSFRLLQAAAPGVFIGGSVGLVSVIVYGAMRQFLRLNDSLLAVTLILFLMLFTTVVIAIPSVSQDITRWPRSNRLQGLSLVFLGIATTYAVAFSGYLRSSLRFVTSPGLSSPETTSSWFAYAVMTATVLAVWAIIGLIFGIMKHRFD